ncbi:MAG: endonuclease Q family protein [Candidatus Micrarchaeaceae archaeon]
MDYISDLHIHSKYAGACSEQLVLENLDSVARSKGIGIIGTGDFTHPLWYKEIAGKLYEVDDSGTYALKGNKAGTRFVLTSEVAVFFQGRTNSRVKKIHNLILAPNLEVVAQINEALGRFGNLGADGRPILQISNSDLIESLHKIDERIAVIPSHAWTPWFGALGQMGFDSIKEAYEDQEKRVFAIETGLSSDPGMNWRVSALDKYALVSWGDAHSLPKLGREATVISMDGGPSYDGIIYSIKEKKIRMTVEFYPEEGKYHLDGHRNCGVSMTPEEAKRYNNICPKCGKMLTIGVLHRVEELADRDDGYRPAGAAPYLHTVPLQEIIAYVTKKGAGTAYVANLYKKLIDEFGTEFNVLLKSDLAGIAKVDESLAKAIENVRSECVKIIPGYDGVFGIIDILGRINAEKGHGRQKQIIDF